MAVLSQGVNGSVGRITPGSGLCSSESGPVKMRAGRIMGLPGRDLYLTCPTSLFTGGEALLRESAGLNSQ